MARLNIFDQLGVLVTHFLEILSIFNFDGLNFNLELCDVHFVFGARGFFLSLSNLQPLFKIFLKRLHPVLSLKFSSLALLFASS